MKIEKRLVSRPVEITVAEQIERLERAIRNLEKMQHTAWEDSDVEEYNWLGAKTEGVQLAQSYAREEARR